MDVHEIQLIKEHPPTNSGLLRKLFGILQIVYALHPDHAKISCPGGTD
jgi:hypothetical protein